MQMIHQALDDVKDLFPKVIGQPPPEIGPHAYAPFPPGVDPIHHALKEVEHLKGIAQHVGPSPAAWAPHADSFVTGDGFLIRVDVAGVARDDLKVLVAGGQCVVRGERKPPEATDQLRPMTLERPWGPFERRFLLPAGSDPSRVTARYRDGILELRIVIDQAEAPNEKEIDVV